MKMFTIAIAAATALMGATFINTAASAGPGFGGPGGFKPGIGKGGGGGFKPGGFKPGMGKKIHPGHGHGKWGHGHGHWGHGHGYGHGRGWGYGAVGFAGAAYFARPVYTCAYVECEWVRVRTAHGLRWRPYC